MNRIVRLNVGRDGLLARAHPIPVPPGIATLPHNKGLECLAFVPAGLPQALTLVAAIALPMVPFLAFIMPLKEILKLLMQLVGR